MYGWIAVIIILLAGGYALIQKTAMGAKFKERVRSMKFDEKRQKIVDNILASESPGGRARAELARIRAILRTKDGGEDSGNTDDASKG